jgi:hypothetical protein
VLQNTLTYWCFLQVLTVKGSYYLRYAKVCTRINAKLERGPTYIHTRWNKKGNFCFLFSSRVLVSKSITKVWTLIFYLQSHGDLLKRVPFNWHKIKQKMHVPSLKYLRILHHLVLCSSCLSESNHSKIIWQIDPPLSSYVFAWVVKVIIGDQIIYLAVLVWISIN